MPDYPPYVRTPGKLPKLFEGIKSAAVPTKFTQDFLETMLDMKSSSDRAFISFLKRLGFIDQANVPTQAYKDYREDSLSRTVMANQIRYAYPQIFQANAYAYKVEKQNIASALKRVLGVADNDTIVPDVVATFSALVALADFDNTAIVKVEKPIEEKEVGIPVSKATSLGLSYTIVLNLPATTDIAVFNAIFKSLRENILGEK